MTQSTAPKILRKFTSAKALSTDNTIGSLRIPVKRKIDPQSPQYEPFSVDFNSMENLVGTEMIKWCEKTISEDATLPEDAKGFCTVFENGQQKKIPVAGMKLSDFITTTWEFQMNYIREDKSVNEKSRMAVLEYENEVLKKKLASAEKPVKKEK